MDKRVIRKFKWFWAWQDEDEEDWLRTMSKEGWHLTGIGFPTIYNFESGERQDYVYRLDYRSHYKMDKEDYRQLFSDAGWEYVEKMAGWHYFRQLAQPGEELEIYTDAESKIEKYQRLLAFLGILTLPLFFSLLNLRSRPYEWVSFYLATLGLIFVLYVYAIIKLWLRISQLKRL